MKFMLKKNLAKMFNLKTENKNTLTLKQITKKISKQRAKNVQRIEKG